MIKAEIVIQQVADGKSVSEVARMNNVSRPTVYRYITKAGLNIDELRNPSIKKRIGKQLKLNQQEVLLKLVQDCQLAVAETSTQIRNGIYKLNAIYRKCEEIQERCEPAFSNSLRKSKEALKEDLNDFRASNRTAIGASKSMELFRSKKF